jgi:ribosomal protein S18 acetylase RimI-like enzyme
MTPDGFQIRSMRDEDVETVVSLWTACGLTRPWNDPYRDISLARGKPNSDVLVGEIEGRIVASVMVGHDGHRGVVYYVSVAPDARRRGLGEAMMREAESWLRARQVEKLNLLIRPENEAVRAFYEKLGYQEEVRINMARRLL